MSADAIFKLADKFEKKLSNWTNESTSSFEENKKSKEIKAGLIEIKRLCDSIYLKYNQSKNTGILSNLMTKVYDVNYHKSMKEIRKAKAVLESLSEGLTQT